MTKDFGEVDVKKGSLTMKTKLFVSILVLVSVVPGALAAGAEGETNVHTGSGQLLVTPVEDSASPNVQTDPGVSSPRLIASAIAASVPENLLLQALDLGLRLPQLRKFTIAPQIGAGRQFFSRPVLRA